MSIRITIQRREGRYVAYYRASAVDETGKIIVSRGGPTSTAALTRLCDYCLKQWAILKDVLDATVAKLGEEKS